MTRIRYVVEVVRLDAGVKVATVLPPLKVGAAAVIAIQLAKLLACDETCTLPVQTPAAVCAVTVPAFIASLKVTAIVDPTATPVAEFAGVVLLIVGAVTSTTAVVQLMTRSVPRVSPVVSAIAAFTQVEYWVEPERPVGEKVNVRSLFEAVIVAVIAVFEQLVPATM